MNHNKFLSILDTAFEHPKNPSTTGGLIAPTAPIDLHEACLASLDGTPEKDAVYEGDPLACLSDAGWSCRQLVGFFWQTALPMVWELYLLKFSHPEHGAFAVLQGDDDAGTHLIARLEAGGGGDSHRILFEQLIRENGAPLGVSVFGSLPSNTHNKDEGAIPVETVREAYWGWMQWKGAFDHEWEAMSEEIALREADPVRYWAEMLVTSVKRLPPVGTEWPRKTTMSERARRAIFDAYFDLSYGPY